MPRKIMIVEDHDAVRKSLKEWLECALPDYTILDVGSGEEALQAARAEGMCLIVMDIGLPGINGLQATRQIKAFLPDVPIVILSIHEDEAYRADAIASGVSAYVPKRLMRTRLLPTLRGLLPAQKARAEPGSGVAPSLRGGQGR